MGRKRRSQLNELSKAERKQRLNYFKSRQNEKSLKVVKDLIETSRKNNAEKLIDRLRQNFY